MARFRIQILDPADIILGIELYKVRWFLHFESRAGQSFIIRINTTGALDQISAQPIYIVQQKTVLQFSSKNDQI